MQPTDPNESSVFPIDVGEDSYDAMYKSCFCALCAFADRYVQDEALAADLVQDAFATLWKMRAKFSSEAAMRSFLYIAVRNAALNCLRSMRRIGPLPERPIAAEGESDEAVLAAELERQLLSRIEQLPQECRKVLQLSLGGMSYKEIGELLRISVSTVHSQRVRAVKLLRQAFAKSS